MNFEYFEFLCYNNIYLLINAWVNLMSTPLVQALSTRICHTVNLDTGLMAAIKKLVDNKIGALPVVGSSGSLEGIISERDILKECLNRSDAINLTEVQDVMNKYVAVVTPDKDLDYATSIMKQKGIRHLPVVVGSKIEGMISMRDIVNLRLQEVEAEISYVGLLHKSTHRRLL